MYRAGTNVEELRFDAVLRQRFCNLGKGGKGASVFVGAAVDKQYLHSIFLLIACLILIILH